MGVVNEASAGAVIVGGVVSRIVIVWVAVAELSEASVAVQVMVVVPMGNDEGASLVTVGFGSSLSVAVAVPICAAVSGVSAPVASKVLSDGAVIVGATVSAAFGDTETLSISTNSDELLDSAMNLRLAVLCMMSSVSEVSSHSSVSWLLSSVYDASVIQLVSSVEYWTYSPSSPST